MHREDPKPKAFKMKRLQDLKPRVAKDGKTAITYENIDMIKDRIVKYLNNEPDPISADFKRYQVLLRAIRTGEIKDEKDIDIVLPDEEDAVLCPKDVSQIETHKDVRDYNNKAL